MRSIKITDLPESKIIEEARIADDYDTASLRSVRIKKEERKRIEYTPVKKDKKYKYMFNFPSKYHYFIFLIMFQNSNEIIPIAIRHCYAISGGECN